MADDDDDQIGRQVVGAMRRKIQPANRTMIGHLEECAEQLALAAAGTAAAQSAFQRGPDLALFAPCGIPRPDFRLFAHGFHDLSFEGLPLFDLPRLPLAGLPRLPLAGLRSFLRGLRPGCAPAWIPDAWWMPSRLLRGATRPSDKSSKRRAPAMGTASTRRTSTTSPSRCMAPLRDPTSAWRASS